MSSAAAENRQCWVRLSYKPAAERKSPHSREERRRGTWMAGELRLQFMASAIRRAQGAEKCGAHE